MGESFMGLPNRFNIIGRNKRNPDPNRSELEIDLKNEKTFNPNHALSAYYGYRLATEYVCRDGGTPFAMNGPFYTQSVIPYGNNHTHTVGDEKHKFVSVWAETFEGDLSGNADTATRLETARKIQITLDPSDENSDPAYNNTNYVVFSGARDVDIHVPTPYLHLRNGGTVNGATNIYGTLTTKTILPKTLANNIQPSIGNSDNKYNKVWANTFEGDLTGNANTATTANKLAKAQNISIQIGWSDSVTPVNFDNNTASFNGESGVNIFAKLPTASTIFNNYLPLTGGTITGTLTLKNELVVAGNKTYGNGNLGPLAISTNYIWTSAATPPTQPFLKVSGEQYGNTGYCIHLYSDDIACNRIVSSHVAEGGQGHSIEIAHTETSTNLSDMSDWVYISAMNYTAQDGVYKRLPGDKGKPGCGRLKCRVLKVNEENITSDIRIKKDIAKIDLLESIELVNKSIPVEYICDNISSSKKTFGFIAQQIKHDVSYSASSTMVATFKSKEFETSEMSLNYIQWVPHFSNILRHLLAKVDTLEVNAGIKDSLEFPDLQKENTFDEAYYREHAEEIAMV